MVSDADCLIGYVTLYLPLRTIKSYNFTQVLFKVCEFLSRIYILHTDMKFDSIVLEFYTVLFLLTGPRTKLQYTV